MLERYESHLPDDLLAACIHCGLCLPTCPTYALTGNEISSPRGRIRLMSAVAHGELGLTEKFREEMHFCLDCRACETACPAGVQYGRLVEGARVLLEDVRPTRVRRALLQIALGSRRRLDVLAWLIKPYSRSALRGSLRRVLARLSTRLMETEALLPELGSALRLSRRTTPRASPRGRVGLVEGCVQRHTHPGVNADTIAVLVRNGFEVVLPDGQGCCGSLHAHMGDRAGAARLVRRLATAFEPLEELDAIIVNAAGCGSFLKHADAALWDPEEGGWNGVRDRNAPVGGRLGSTNGAGRRLQLFVSKIRDATEFLAEVGWERPSGRMEARATYHDPCHLVHGQKISAAPREILASIPGLELVPLPESTWCCGSAGIYNITHPEAARRLLDRKLENVASTGASLLVTANPGCFIQLQAGLRISGMDVELAHPLSLLARGYDVSGRRP